MCADNTAPKPRKDTTTQPPARSPQPRGRSTRRSPQEYDDELLVDLLADGAKSYAQVAEEVGLSRSMVGKIARGEFRRDLANRARRIRAHRTRSLEHLAGKWAEHAMNTHVREGLEGTGETARKCREFIINVARQYDAIDESIKEKDMVSTLDALESLDDRLDQLLGIEPDDDGTPQEPPE